MVNLFKQTIKNKLWVYTKIAQGIALGLLLFLVYFMLNQTIPASFDTIGLQSRIENSDQISDWLQKHADGIPTALTAYSLGRIFSESVAYTIGENIPEAIKRLTVLAKVTPDVKDIMAFFKDRPGPFVPMDKKILIQMYKNIQAKAEDYTLTQGQENLVLFRFGAWLSDMTLINAMQDRATAFQLNSLFIRQLSYFKKHIIDLNKNPQITDLFITLNKKPLSTDIMQETLGIVISLQKKFNQQYGAYYPDLSLSQRKPLNMMVSGNK